MAPQNPTPPGDRTNGESERNDRSYWNWLLAVAVVVPLFTFLYNRTEPRLAGIPFFYWMQLAFIAVGVVATAVVYTMTKQKGR
ncbi:MAG TPA: DUF3311 domain-containing protein [Streptosporangiaceae bacterium]|nr:DUF3311 domain-containing protein [Streptosporangiaceae bacterium]